MGLFARSSRAAIRLSRHSTIHHRNWSNRGPWERQLSLALLPRQLFLLYLWTIVWSLVLICAMCIVHKTAHYIILTTIKRILSRNNYRGNNVRDSCHELWSLKFRKIPEKVPERVPDISVRNLAEVPQKGLNNN